MSIELNSVEPISWPDRDNSQQPTYGFYRQGNSLSMKSLKEKQLLVKWAKAMNEPIDAALVEEVERYEQLQNEIKQSIKTNSIKDLLVAAQSVPVKEETVKEEIEYPLPPTLEEVLDFFKEQIDEPAVQEVEEPAKEDKPADIVSVVANHITNEVKLEERADSYQQPDAEFTSRSVNDIRKKIKFLEDWLSKISLTGPGGGAGDVINLDHPVKLVTNNYTITRKDYYIGVNAASSVTITLPDAIGFPGRKVVIKDESGNCSSNPITVLGNVDNDPGGFILQMDNGGIQMIYREGWRII